MDPRNITRIGTVRSERTVVEDDDWDAVDGSPVLDVKPWVRQLGPRGDVRQAGWMDELMAGYCASPGPERAAGPGRRVSPT